jgi:hypothetical protein
VRAARLGVPGSAVEDAVLEHHRNRTVNPGAAMWRVSVGRLVVAYDYPDGEDQAGARVITVWRA